MSPTFQRPFQNDFRKYANSSNLFMRPKDMILHEEISNERRERMKRWITFFRRNPHRFIETYFGITLHPYQILIIWILQRSNFAYIVASRAAAKTWIIAVWSLTLAVLYPGIKIVVCAKTLKQGGILISEKIANLKTTFPNVAREIRDFTANANVCEVIFHCGSTIKVVPSSENAKGTRANYIIIEESRLVPKFILESVIKPFSEVRTPPYRLKSAYSDDSDLKEEGTISYITSAWYKSEYWYSYVKSCVKRMAGGDETSNFLALDYLISLRHNIKTEAMIKNEMEDADPLTVQMEYLNIPSGTSGKSYFKPTLFKREIKKAFYPQFSDNYNSKRNPYDLKRTDGELRFVGVDIATRANKTNDQTIISCVRLTPMLGKGYARDLVYMESHKGANTLIQAKRIKEIFTDFDSNFVVLDLQQAGISIFDSLSQVTLCEEKNITFPAMTVVGNEYDFVETKLREELESRTLGVGALPVVFPILASQSLNSQIAVSFRSSLQKKLWNFLLPESEAEDFLIRTNKEFMGNSDDSEIYARFLMPYTQTSLLIGECINLDMALVNGMIKLTEKPGAYKDRFSSVSYTNWIISEFDKTLLKEREESDDLKDLLDITQVV